MPFLHLLVSASASENDDFELVVFNLTAEQLNSQFAVHWKKGDEVQHKRVWRAADIKRVHVVSTDETAERALERLREQSNQQLDSAADQGIFFPLAPRDSDILECGTDVTATHFPSGSLREAAPVPSPKISPLLRGALLYVVLPLLVTILGGVAVIYFDRSTTPTPTSAGAESIAAPERGPASKTLPPAPAIDSPVQASASTDTTKKHSDTTRLTPRQ